MKKLIYLLSIILISCSLHAQIVAASINQDFKELSSSKSIANAGYEGIQTYNTGTVNGNQFYSQGWVSGSVTTLDNKTVQDDNYVFLYDKVRQVLFIKNKADNNAQVLTADPDKLKAFTLVTDKTHSFIKASIFDPTLKNEFFEVLAQGSNYTLLKLNKANFEKADEHDMLAMKNGDFSDAFVDHTTYYIFHNSKLEKTNLQQYSIRKNLKDEKDKVDNYFNMHQREEMNEGLFVGLINFLNA